METKPTLERDDTITPEDESLQIISIRKLDRLETTLISNSSGA
jgi:hypothetical protein